MRIDYAEVASWFETEVGLPQYYNAFVLNGYGTMAKLLTIWDRQELQRIGVMLLGHQTKIMGDIRRLRRHRGARTRTREGHKARRGSRLNALVENVAYMTQQTRIDFVDLASWFETEVGLPQYYNAFVLNGYGTMATLLTIRDKEELKRIGVPLLGHQTKIMGDIRRLRHALRLQTMVDSTPLRSTLSTKQLMATIENNSDIKSKRVVRGYIRQSEAVFSMRVPDNISFLCLAYYLPSVFDYLSPYQASLLRVGDAVDHRDTVGRFLLATIMETKGTKLRISYGGWSHKSNIWSDYANEPHLFAIAGSVSKRPAHRLKHLHRGSFVDVNPPRHPGWRSAEIVDCRSGQVQVVYEHDHESWVHWVHLDNTDEVAEFTMMADVELDARWTKTMLKVYRRPRDATDE